MAKFCQKCGTELNDTAEFCDNCGAQQNQQPPTQQTPNVNVNVTNVATAHAGVGGIQPSPKSRLVALILWFFLGLIGGHYFYAGRFGMGFLYLCTGGFFGIGWIIDLFVIIGGGFKDSFGRPMR